ncbi:MAG: anthranilate phosphoribosyltransferase [Candidatus Omnitrophica bacterium]|nr:anthranilate phosphoribosyltransferase [Candidatus Omnitrophota bacterium]
MMVEVILKLMEDKDLEPAEMQKSMEEILSGKVNNSQIAAFLVLLRKKGETAEELATAVEVMLKFCRKVYIERDLILDTCGTGGDGSSSFNVSTAVAFVVAGLGITVAKHGNRAISSACGSADLIEELGVEINIDEKKAKIALENIGIVFLFAPNFHPAMKYALPVRRELGLRTIFNLIGPLSNPVNITHQLVGVYDKRWLKIVAQTLKKLGRTHAMVVYSEDGLDEISINDKTYAVELKRDRIIGYTIDPRDFGFRYPKQKRPLGKDPATNAKILLEILKGKRSVYRDIVLLNAAAAIYITDRAKSVKEGIELARYSIDEGLALKKLELLRDFSKKYGK